MSKREALKALLDYIDDHCCWGRRPAKKLEVKSVTSSTAFKYQIASYTETRRIHGGWIDDDGEVSRMWDIAVPKPFYPEDEASNPVEYEVDSTYDTKLNHTEEVWTCHRCRGSGRVRCTRCRGSGRINRTDSEGRQYRANCPRCYGSGRVTCGTCDGSGRLVWYKVVVTTFKTIFDDYIFMTKMDDDVIHAATGDKIMFSAGRRVGAITHFEPEEVAQNSKRLVGRHRGLNNGRCNLWRMTHKLQSVPVFEVKYELDDDDGIFWIADYPAQCCCICNVPGCFNNCHKCNNCVLL
ncbi:Oidioi.mRNA.OKI2018_I69.XSR.g15117.t1.cds [Oikopleura dioica]|uniref:Oidioi.mRNA.OKI2018_I69.XSR.g15117.t1.cds n=1 Tax=Oikopleura dioica TaxID=34765 RepID=A0ABN7SH09_OIKDI|nr:Oidioi.mRNA.OKI2018_I69.XSR.g15117.t1.cds [Oikopleura dioica]